MGGGKARDDIGANPPDRIGNGGETPLSLLFAPAAADCSGDAPPAAVEADIGKTNVVGFVLLRFLLFQLVGRKGGVPAKNTAGVVTDVPADVPNNRAAPDGVGGVLAKLLLL